MLELISRCGGLAGRLGAFICGRDGGVALLFALLFPVLLGCVGVGADYASWLVRKQKLQAIADETALAVVSDMQVGGYDRSRIQAVAEGQVRSLTAHSAVGDPVAVKTEPVRRRPGANADGAFVPVPAGDGATPPTGVRVILSQRKRAIITLFVTPHLTDIVVQATAEIVGTSRICVVALDGGAAQTIGLRDNARVSATNCSVYALSNAGAAIDARDSAQLNAMKSCTVGGYAGSSQHYQPVPITGCPVIRDPVAGRTAPPVGGCDYTDKMVSNRSETLNPGTYCGGLVLISGANVRLNPGIYIMKNGPLVVGTDTWTDGGKHAHHHVPCLCYHNDVTKKMKDRLHCPIVPTWLPPAALSGDGVGFYFTGTVHPEDDGIARPLQFMPRSNVSRGAPTDGAMAGLLFFEDRAAPANRVFEILSDNARRLVGTIYMPRGTFLVVANQVVADRSESQAPRLVVNANYGATRVPVPQGLGPTSTYPTLTQ